MRDICEAPGCEKERKQTIYCWAHYQRLRYWGVLERRPLLPVERVLRRTVALEDGCWAWMGGPNGDGYGQVKVGNRRPSVHRVVYQYYRGDVPVGLELDHLCRRRNCVNPMHLEAVTHRENILRGAATSAINAAKTHCVNGHPFDEENTLSRSDGGRRCRICRDATNRRVAERQRALAWT